MRSRTSGSKGPEPGRRRRENIATIEGRKSVAKVVKREAIKCQFTTPPDRTRHPIFLIAPTLRGGGFTRIQEVNIINH
jgi:hypothetical protein